MKELDINNIFYLNFGQYLLEYLDQRDIVEVFQSVWGGHYNEEGNQVVANFVYAHIKPLVLKQTNKQEQ
jgi:hypothetical protein